MIFIIKNSEYMGNYCNSYSPHTPFLCSNLLKSNKVMYSMPSKLSEWIIPSFSGVQHTAYDNDNDEYPCRLPQILGKWFPLPHIDTQVIHQSTVVEKIVLKS